MGFRILFDIDSLKACLRVATKFEPAPFATVIFALLDLRIVMGTASNILVQV